MTSLIVAVCLLAQAPTEGGEKPAPQSDAAQRRIVDYLRGAYRADAEKYDFYHDAEQKLRLKMVDKPIMRWANDDDWSGDVFVWTHSGRPEVVGCILSGPAGTRGRPVFHEFHLLAEKPIAAVDLQTHRRWEPKEGLALSLVPDAGAPAATAAARLTQMRQLSRAFTAHMAANGEWELRLLPQPLFRYGDEKGEVVDGALFAYVWTKGTDPEVVLLLECRKTASGPAWHYAPVRFSNRPVWLRHGDQEVWRVESHREPQEKTTSMIYTTAFARHMPAQPPDDAKANPRSPEDNAKK